MPLTVLSWNSVTFSGLSNPLIWVPQTYQAPSFVVDAIVAAAPVNVFCISDAGAGGPAVIAFLGGTATIPSSSLASASSVTTDTTVMDDGETWYSMRGATTQWYFYQSNAGIVRALTNSTILGAFIS